MSRTLQDRLAEALHDSDLSQAELARRVGIKQSSVNALLHGTAERTKFVFEIAEALHVRPEWLHFGAPPKKSDDPDIDEINATIRKQVSDKQQAPIWRDDDEIGYVPAYDLRLSAGAGAVVDEQERPTRYESFRVDWLQSLTATTTDWLALVWVSGDSMEPLLHDGDQVLIDRGRTKPTRDGIYALRLDDDLVIKRVSMHPVTKLLTIASDNPSYPTYDGIKPEDVHIIGRAIWIGRRI